MVERPSSPTRTRFPWDETDDLDIFAPSGTGTASTGKSFVSFPCAVPVLGTDEIAGFRFLDFGRPGDSPGVAVGISSLAVSDGCGCGFQDGLVALAALPPWAGDGRDEGTDDGEGCSPDEETSPPPDAAAAPDTFTGSVVEDARPDLLEACLAPAIPLSSAQAPAATSRATTKTAPTHHLVLMSSPSSLRAGTSRGCFWTYAMPPNDTR